MTKQNHRKSDFFDKVKISVLENLLIFLLYDETICALTPKKEKKMTKISLQSENRKRGERDTKHVTIIDANKDTDRKTKVYRKRIEKKTVREILAWPSKFCKVMKSFFLCH
jgi:hypothetical protein